MFVESNIRAELSAHYLEVRKRLWGGPPPPPKRVELPASPLMVVAAHWRRHDNKLGFTNPSVETVINVAAEYFKISPDVLKNDRNRKAPLIRIRKAIIYIVHDCCPNSNKYIGRVFHCCPSAVWHSYVCAKELMATDYMFAEAVEYILTILRAERIPPRPAEQTFKSHEWTATDEGVLSTMCAAGRHAIDIAEAIGCTQFDVRGKARKMSLIFQTPQAFKARERRAIEYAKREGVL